MKFDLTVPCLTRVISEQIVDFIDWFVANFEFMDSTDYLLELKNVEDCTAWFIRFCRAATDLSFGARPDHGFQLCSALSESLCDKDIAKFLDTSLPPALLRGLLATLIGNSSYCLFSLGRFDDAIALAIQHWKLLGSDAFSEDYWNLNIQTAECHLALAQFDEAIRLFEKIEQYGSDGKFKFSSVRNRINRLRQSHHDLPDTRSREARSKEVWDNGITSQLDTIVRYGHFRRALVGENVWRRDFQPRVSQLLEAAKVMQSLLSSKHYIEIEETLIQLDEQMYVGMLDLLNRGSDNTNVSDQISHLLRRAAFLIHNPDGALLSDSAFQHVHDALLLAEKHCLETGDLWHRAESLWCLTILYVRQKMHQAALATCKKLFSELRQWVSSTENPNIRASLVNRYPGLQNRLFEIALTNGDVDFVCEISELRRSTQSGSHKPRPISTGENLSAKNTCPGAHFLSLSSHYYGNMIYAFLETASGEKRSGCCKIRRDEIQKLLQYASPSTWLKYKNFRPGKALPDVSFAPLFELIESAYQDGLICKDDHLVLALDYPLNLVPCSYVRIGNQRMIDLFSISRATSYRDYQQILNTAERPHKRVGFGALAVNCPALDETFPDERYLAFQQVVTALECGAEPIVLNGTTAARANVVASLTGKKVIHLQTHGYYPTGNHNKPGKTIPSNPLTGSGLLLANANELPSVRNNDPVARLTHLLTPAQLLQMDLDLKECHVSLCACVSGLSHEANSGDLLGLEYAFREMGAASVLASLWEIDYQVASSTLARFYEAWLANGMTKAQALRVAMLSGTNAEEDDVSAANWFGFEIFGNWM